MSGANPNPGRTALVLAGGGMTGAVYEMGALRALDEILLDHSVTDFDIYVGTSAGAFVSSLLANGIDPASLLMAAEDPESPLGRMLMRHVYSPNLGEIPSRLRRIPEILVQFVDQVARERELPHLSELFMLLSPLIPSGLLDSDAIRRFLHLVLSHGGLSDSFGQLTPELNIIATRLDNFERVVFGPRHRNDVRVSTAVAASTAVPLLYRPVKVRGQYFADGGVKGTASIDVAVDAGATLVVVINPLVPVDMTALKSIADGEHAGDSIYELGVRGIYNQILRGMVHDTLLSQLREQRRLHPEVDFILIEPRPDDPKMFFHEVMSFSARLMVAQHGYESVTIGLQNSREYIAQVLGRHGIRLTREALDRAASVLPTEAVEEPSDTLVRRLQRTIFAPPPPSRRRRRAAMALRAAEGSITPRLRLVRALDELDQKLG